MTLDDARDEERAWALLQALAAQPAAAMFGAGTGACLGAAGALETVPLEAAWVSREAGAGLGVGLGAQQRPALAQMLELYLPLCNKGRESSVVFAHVGQSLDGQIATDNGASRYVSGPENIRHMHRLRALCDAVIVGASTVHHDDPQLTTRLVPGRSPVRVVIDPSRRLPPDRRVFRDGAARTIVVCARGRLAGAAAEDVVEIAERDGVLPPRDIVAALAERGLYRLFVEGGGITVSRFLEARALQRLHITISPLFIGKGRPGISLPPVHELEHALRPKVRHFALGADVLFDCEWP